MTDAQFYNKFMEVLDKGIALYTEALNTERGDDSWWLFENSLNEGLCGFFVWNDLEVVADWIEMGMAEKCFVCPIGWGMTASRHERFAKRLAILKQIKKELE